MDKGRAGAKFSAPPMNIRKLPRSLRTDPLQRAGISARKRVEQATYVLQREQESLDERTKRRDAAKAELEAAQAELVAADEAIASAQAAQPKE